MPLTVSAILAFGGRLGPPSWSSVAVIVVTGIALMWSSRRRGLGGSTTAAVAVITGLFLAYELSHLL